MLDKEIWEKRHKDSYGRFNRVTDFARLCYFNFMKTKKKAKVLDLCSGKGADSIFFHNKEVNVTAVDYSNEAIKQFNETQKRYEIFLTSFVSDISQPLNFEDDVFDFVYCRLGLHYFTDKELKKILPEINRVLKREGLFMFQVITTKDKKYKLGEKIEKDMYEDETGHVRHFFTKEYGESFLKEYNIIMIEERQIPNGNAYLEVVAEKN